MDFKNAFEAAKMPIMVLVALNIIFAIVGIIPMLGFIAGILSLLMLPIGLLLYAYAGYEGVKKFKMDLSGGAVAGAVAAVVAGVINSIISFVLIMLGVGAVAASLAQMGIGAGIASVALLIALVVGIIIGAIIGAICGAIGAFVAKKK